MSEKMLIVSPSEVVFKVLSRIIGRNCKVLAVSTDGRVVECRIKRIQVYKTSKGTVIRILVSDLPANFKVEKLLLPIDDHRATS